MSLWIPPAEAQRRADGQARRAAALLHAADLTQQLRKWNRELERFDPKLQLILCPERLSPEAQSLGLKPGRYALIRLPSEVVKVLDAEPDSGLFEWLRKGDLWSDRSQKERRRLQKQAQRAAERERAREDEDRVAEITERLRSRSGLSVRVPRAV